MISLCGGCFTAPAEATWRLNEAAQQWNEIRADSQDASRLCESGLPVAQLYS